MNVIGHENALRYLKVALLSERMSPSLLFIGREGIGKKKVALELAKSLLCENPNDEKTAGKLISCDNCEACRKVDKVSHQDLFILNKEIQAILIKEKAESQTALKIEAIRHVDKFLQLKPIEGKRRIVIMEDADEMTNDAANALLKTLEEPPNNGQIILLAKDDRTLPLTIKSRCAVLKLKPHAVADIARWLNSVHGVDAETALDAAGRSAGSFAEALRIKDDKSDETVDISTLDLDEFFEALSEPSFRKEGRERAGKLLLHMIERANQKLELGDMTQESKLTILLKAKRQLERHVTPRLILENVYLQLNRLSEKTTA